VEDPRTLQANERTLLAWLRTGLSLITFGFVIAKTAVWLRLSEVGGSHVGSHGIGTVFIFLGSATEVLGLVRFLRVRRALLARQPAPAGAVSIVVVALVAAALGILLGLFGLGSG
jgi:putative membrane protein